MATKNDKGITGLLELLTYHPELIRELVLDQAQIKKLLGGQARRLVPGEDLTGFLTYMASPEGGYPIAYAQCVGGTGGNSSLCAKGTGAWLACVGGTGTNPKQ